MTLNRDDIRQLQAGLRLLGYDDIGAIDGRAGPKTQTEITAFLQSQQSPIDPQDMPAILAAVREEVARNPDAQRRLAALATNIDSLDTDQRRMLQAGLNMHGLTGADGQPLALDGRIGTHTRSAVAAFNSSADPATLDADQLRLLQGGLNALGFDAGRIDGITGPRTENARLAFLQSQNLPADTDPAATLRALQDHIKSGAAQDRMQAILTGPSTPQQIMALQAALTLSGQPTTLDGRIGSQTRDNWTQANNSYNAAKQPEITTPENTDTTPLAPAEDTTAPRTLHTIEQEQRDLVAAPPFAGLDGAYYLDAVRNQPDSFASLRADFAAQAKDSPFYQNLVNGMDALQALENERQELIGAALSPVTTNLNTVAEIEQAQRALLNHPTIAALSADDPERYLKMMQNAPELFDKLHEYARERSGDPDSVYTHLSDVMTQLRDLEDRRLALVEPSATPQSTTPVISEQPAHPFGLGGETVGSLLIQSMAAYRDMPPAQAETQFVADRLKEIHGPSAITLTDAAITLSVYQDISADIDRNAIGRVLDQMNLPHDHRFDINDPAAMNRVLTGLAALENGGLSKISAGTAATIAEVSGHNPATPTIETPDPQRNTPQLSASM